ncbi:polysaccharide pyruvyl transferase family protein [Prosthecobacter vanneervenii]|uniref:Polysaccharide pyruvyl transferase domain-containing protein n=1 Tax=Prosthecobacter vanneervenii TaxID=48466 RepID=A0A7W7Y8R4_9BACT|nr:polysaccharide pyruvyl transferase family protein [Prosthecobacter vanneervenii]MBB5031711.1 hypothetical protein [Prosthecobacter vanneervenii]
MERPFKLSLGLSSALTCIPPFFDLMSLLTRASHYSRWCAHHLAAPRVAIIGEYHGANLGDHLLGTAVSGYFREQNLQSVRLTLHSLARWRRFPDADVVVGGGNVLNDHSLRLLHTYFKGHRKSAYCMGVDFSDPEVLNRHRDVLDQFALVTFRSEAQRALAAEVLGPSWHDRLGCHPDLAWLHQTRVRQSFPGWQPRRRIALNILPLYLRENGSSFCCAYDEGHHFHNQARRETTAYLQIVEKTVRHYLSKGYEVVHLPFAVEDAAFASQWLRPMGVRCMKYTLGLKSVLGTLSSCEAFIATRFHALVLGLMTGMPIRPIPYARKNSDLLAELGQQTWASQTPRSFCEDASPLTELLCEADAVRMPQAVSADFDAAIKQWMVKVAP